MANFLTGKELNEAIYDIIWNASENLIIVSPFIKLDEYFKTLFVHHKRNHKLHITIVFGKNEGEPYKSLRREDFDFFTQFTNISIVYCPNLHAKYYSNEKQGIITSINLYDKSFENNIEYGILYSSSLINNLTNGADVNAWNYSFTLADSHPAVFIKRPIYEKTLLGFTKNFIDSEVLHDQTNLLLKNWRKWESESKKFMGDFAGEILNAERSSKRPEKTEEVKPAPVYDYSNTSEISNYKHKASPTNYYEKPKQNYQNRNPTCGFCIRTGVEIPFNPEKPMCYDAYNTWAQFQNYDYPEKYCHRTGKPSFGKTSMRNPVMYSY